MAVSNPPVFQGNLLGEDLSMEIAQIGNESTPVSMILPDRGSRSSRTEWPERGLAARALNANTWGDAYTFDGPSAGNRRANLTQIIQQVVFVDGTSIATETMAGGNPIVDQTRLHLVEYLNDVEYNIIRATLVSGESGTAQQMAGLVDWALQYGDTTTGTRSWTTTNSGQTVTTAFFAQMQNRMRRSGTRLTDLLVSDAVRRHLSVQSSSTEYPTYRSQADNTIIEAVGSLRNDFGEHILHTTDDVPQPNDTGFGVDSTNGNIILGIDRSLVEKAWLRQTRMFRLPPREDGIAAVIQGEVTLRVWASAALHADWNVFAPAF